jgi:hypothetical protein
MKGRVLLGFGGAIAVIGSFMGWATFSVFFSFLSRSGIELGYGVASALLGVALVASTAKGGQLPDREARMLILGSLGILALAGIAAVSLPAGLSGLEFHQFSLGLVLTAVGGGLACVGGALRLRPRDVR